MGSSGSGNARPPKQTSIFVEEEKPSTTAQYPSSNYIPIRGEVSVNSKVGTFTTLLEIPTLAYLSLMHL